MSKLFFSTLVALGVAAVLIVAENDLTIAYFPHLDRPTTDFSAAYLRRELRTLAAAPPTIIFLGDSVLWGYRLRGDQAAASILKSQGCACVNLAFKSGNPAGDYVLTRLLLAARIRPRLVVLDVNQAVLNESDTYYQSLHPALATLGAPFLTPADRAALTLPAEGTRLQRWVDHLLSSISQPYAMRSDIREAFGGDVQPNPISHLTPELFEATYDLFPLNEKNVGVHYLESTVELWQRSGVPVLAFLTPSNHGLLHRYIDNSHYLANVTFLERKLAERGARVLNLDSAFPANEFLDNAHLTAGGQRRLAAKLAPFIFSARAYRNKKPGT